MIPKQYKVTGFHRETYDNFTLTVDMKGNNQPGQFVEVSIPGIGEAPISICSYAKDHIKLNIKEVGNVTNALSKLKKGEKIFLRGPYGRGYPMEYFKGDNIIIIGGGVGVAPLIGIVDYLEHKRADFKDVHLFLGYKSPDDILFKEQIKEWKKKYNLTVTVDKNEEGKFCYDATVEFITETVKKTDMTNERRMCFVCGPPVMMRAAVKVLKEKGFHDDQIYLSLERQMKCGIQKCGHCMINGTYVCKDGPVFRYDEVLKLRERW